MGTPTWRRGGGLTEKRPEARGPDSDPLPVDVASPAEPITTRSVWEPIYCHPLDDNDLAEIEGNLFRFIDLLVSIDGSIPRGPPGIDEQRRPSRVKAKQMERTVESSAARSPLVPAFAYARVSSKEQEREGYSIPVQLKRVHEYAERHGFAIVAEYVDVETAKEPGRREFSHMVEAARHDTTIGAIICEKVDRLCRNLRDYLTIDELPAKTLFWQQDFPDNAAGKLSFGMMVLLAKHYIDNLSDEVKKGMAEKVQEGGFPHQAPLGYRNVREGDRQVIVPDPVKAPMVRRAYELYATRAYSLKTLRKKLRDEGLATTKHGKLISLSQLEWLLKNRFTTAPSAGRDASGQAAINRWSRGSCGMRSRRPSAPMRGPSIANTTSHTRVCCFAPPAAAI